MNICVCLPTSPDCGEFGEILFKHRQVRCKKKHILPPLAATSPVFALLRRGKQVQWSGSGMKRLHKRMKWAASQASRNVFSEDVKKSLRLLSEERLRRVKWRLASSLFFCPKFGQKNGSGTWIRTKDQVVNSHLLYRWAMPEQRLFQDVALIYCLK